MVVTYFTTSYRTTAMSYSLLYVDPDESTQTETAATLSDSLADLDPDISTAVSLAEATEALTVDLSVLITEYDLPDGTGFELIKKAQDVCPDAACILYTDADVSQLNTDDLHGAITEYVGKHSVFGDNRLTDLVRTSLTTTPHTDYPKPQTEAERLTALRSYALDDPKLVGSLDRITDLAAAHFEVEIASVNIIDDRSQEFLACHGAAEEWESMHREDSICTFTIVEDADVMTVADVAEDPRFASRSGSLIDMGIRSYMGASLVTASGLPIGTLCVYDNEVRSFSADDEAYLKDLATTAMNLIDAYARTPAMTDDGGAQ